MCYLPPYIRRSYQRLWASRSSSRLAVCSRVKGLKTLLDLFIFIHETVGVVLEDYAAAQVECIASLSYPLEVRDNVGRRPLNSYVFIRLQVLLACEWPVAKILAKLVEILGRPEMFRLWRDMLLDFFEGLLL